MNKTEHYQLNQWDPEDRILRVDFNADNAAIESALKENADAVSAEAAARSAADTSIRTDFAAADTNIRTDFAAADSAVRSEFAAADNTIKTSVSNEATARANADTAIRSEFAAADTKIRTDFAAADNTIKSSLNSEISTRKSEDTAIRTAFAAADTAVTNKISMVRLLDTTTTSAATQINISVSGLNLHTYHKVIIIPQIKFAKSGDDLVRVRLNNKSGSIYYGNGSLVDDFLRFDPCYNHSTTYYNGAAEISLYLSGPNIVGFSQNANGYQVSFTSGMVPSATLAPSAISTINFYTASSISLAAGSRVLIYGVK